MSTLVGEYIVEQTEGRPETQHSIGNARNSTPIHPLDWLHVFARNMTVTIRLRPDMNILEVRVKPQKSFHCPFDVYVILNTLLYVLSVGLTEIAYFLQRKHLCHDSVEV